MRKLFLLFILVLAAPAFADRTETQLSFGWHFLRQDAPGAEAPTFDDNLWQSVSVPHTWNAEDGARGGPYYRGPGWYRLHLKIPAAYSGKSLFLRFGAASLSAKVYVNGALLGEHAGGFGAFCLDATDALHTGDNLLAVRVDNSADPNIPPLSGDFTIDGGLYREVKLLALDPVSVSPMDDASSGVYLNPKAKGNHGSLDWAAIIRNGSANTALATVTCKVFDAQGHLLRASSADQVLGQHASGTATGYLAVRNPHLWNGVLNPYLYTAIIDVRVNGRLVDRVEQPFGFRTFRVDPVKGFFLNGKPYDLHGVCLHQGRPSTGWAASPEMQQEDYRLISELGCTMVRMAHYQHAPYEMTLCDQRGIVVWAELCLVNRMTNNPQFRDNAKQQLRELIKQNFDHPSVCFWSMYNEPWIDRKAGPDEWNLVKELIDEAHQLDPNRLTTGAASIGVKEPLDWFMDVTAFNRYWGWYDGPISGWRTQLDAMRKEAGHPFGMSEYGAGASTRQHEVNPAQPKTTGHWHPEEYQSALHEAAWPAMAARPWMWCKLVWVMFDFASAERNEGDLPGINDKGLVTGDRMVRKDAFFYYKANWTTKPFVYITDRRFNPRPFGPTDVKVYSNCAKVELFVNGQSLGIKESPNHIFIWAKVDLSGMSAEVVAHGVNAPEARDELTWIPAV